MRKGKLPDFTSFTYNQRTRRKIPLGRRMDYYEDQSIRNEMDTQWHGAEPIEPVPYDAQGRWETIKEKKLDGDVWSYTREFTRFQMFAPSKTHFHTAKSKHHDRFQKAKWRMPDGGAEVEIEDCLEENVEEVDEVQDAAKGRKIRRQKAWKQK